MIIACPGAVEASDEAGRYGRPGLAWEYEVVARNTATESTNRMHDDTVAATYGFRGGLVPGVDVWAYLTRPCTDRWGTEFLERGTMELRFRSPVYDGEVVQARLDDDGSLTATGPVRLGPWIHVHTRAHHRGLVRDGTSVEVRGVVVDEREHRGHRFVDLDVEISADGRPVWSAAHTAIWQPRRERQR